MKTSLSAKTENAQRSTGVSKERPHFANPQSGRLAQLAGMMNQSPRVQAQLKLADEIQSSERVRNQLGLAAQINHAPAAQLWSMDDDDPAQRKSRESDHINMEHSSAPAQREEAPVPNRTGLPDQLKAGVENLSGISLNDVKVHYNSAKPAQFNALAYAQGTDIHVAPGQEKHLPHEAWHIVQQKQGRVKPTLQMKAGVPINDDPGLEKEADVIGAKAFRSSRQGAPILQRQKEVIQKTPPSDENWDRVNQAVTTLRKQSWVQSAFPVAQGSQVALKDINSEGICRTIVLEWLRRVKSNHRTDYLQKFTSGDVDDLVAIDNEFTRQGAIWAARNAPSAPAREQVELARSHMTRYLSVGGTEMTWIVPKGNEDTQAVIDAVKKDGFYQVTVHWMEKSEEKSEEKRMDKSEEKGHALGIIKNGNDYYFLDPSFYEVKGTSTVLAYVKRILDSTYGSKKTSPRYGLLFAAGTVDSGGWCFLTTAAAEARGLPDNCQELTTLRRYRDGYLRRHKGGPEAIEHYYKVAPRILKAIAGREDRSEILDHIYEIVLHCISHIRRRHNAEAFKIYRQMVTELEAMLGLEDHENARSK